MQYNIEEKDFELIFDFVHTEMDGDLSERDCTIIGKTLRAVNDKIELDYALLKKYISDELDKINNKDDYDIEDHVRWDMLNQFNNAVKDISKQVEYSIIDG